MLVLDGILSHDLSVFISPPLHHHLLQPKDVHALPEEQERLSAARSSRREGWKLPFEPVRGIQDTLPWEETVARHHTPWDGCSRAMPASGEEQNTPLAIACASSRVSLTRLCRSGRTVARRVPYRRRDIKFPISGGPARCSAFSN